MTRVAYLDASAIVKLVVDEIGTESVRSFVSQPGRYVTSRVGVVETRRAAMRRERYDRSELDAVLSRLETVELDTALADRAAALGPPSLRTLDAIHLATALELGSDLEAFVTYDARLADAARTLGLPVAAPA